MRRAILMLIGLMSIAATPATTADSITPQLRKLMDHQAALTADRFAEPPALQILEGQEFRVRIPFLSGDRTGVGAGGSGMWTYADGQLTLSIIPSEVGLRSGARTKGTALIYKTEAVKSGGYVGENAFGARRSVQSYTVREFGIFPLAKPVGEFSQFTTADTLEWYQKLLKPDQIEAKRTNFVLKITAAGAVAKRLSQQSYAVVSGRLAPREGRAWECESSYVGAKLTHPTEAVTDRCWLFGNVESVQFIDGANGTVLKRWAIAG